MCGNTFFIIIYKNFTICLWERFSFHYKNKISNFQSAVLHWVTLLETAEVNLFVKCLGHLQLGNCDRFYFTFEFECQMWAPIFQKIEKDQIPICHLSNKLKLNTNKPIDIWIIPNLNEY